MVLDYVIAFELLTLKPSPELGALYEEEGITIFLGLTASETYHDNLGQKRCQALKTR